MIIQVSEILQKLGETIASALPSPVLEHRVANGELTILAAAGDIVKVATFLRDDERCQFWSIIDITAIDWPGRERRFDVVYHFLSPKQNQRIRVKVEVDESTPGRLRSLMYSLERTGSSARPTISMASCSLVIPICAGC